MTSERSGRWRCYFAKSRGSTFSFNGTLKSESHPVVVPHPIHSDMTPNDALSQLQKSHRQSRSPQNTSSTPSLRHRLTRSPSPAISLRSQTSWKSYSSTYSSDSDSSTKPMNRRKPAKPSANGLANGIAHVPEETSGDERSLATLTSGEELKRKEKNKPKVDWEIPRKALHSSIGNTLSQFACYSTDASHNRIPYIGSIC
jgi:hypothetical protein